MSKYIFCWQRSFGELSPWSALFVFPPRQFTGHNSDFGSLNLRVANRWKYFGFVSLTPEGLAQLRS